MIASSSNQVSDDAGYVVAKRSSALAFYAQNVNQAVSLLISESHICMIRSKDLVLDD